jgi:hypothetical protein
MLRFQKISTKKLMDNPSLRGAESQTDEVFLRTFSPRVKGAEPD